METANLELMARLEHWQSGISLYARTKSEPRHEAMALMLKKADVGCVSEPFMTLDIGASQQLMDELWSCGIRPSEGSGSAGSLRATEKHLADMHKIAFHKLGIKE